MTREMALKLAVIFRHQVNGGSFPACWTLADVVPVLNKSPASDVGDYRSISITPVQSKVFVKIVAGKSSNFLERNSKILFLSFRIEEVREHLMFPDLYRLLCIYRLL